MDRLNVFGADEFKLTNSHGYNYISGRLIIVCNKYDRIVFERKDYITIRMKMRRDIQQVLETKEILITFTSAAAGECEGCLNETFVKKIKDLELLIDSVQELKSKIHNKIRKNKKDLIQDLSIKAARDEILQQSYQWTRNQSTKHNGLNVIRQLATVVPYPFLAAASQLINEKRLVGISKHSAFASFNAHHLSNFL
ncbi:unnamed protein product [Didymodactylos carnosus]|uniref:Uncharacterized protein n=1 Tax=Didymodactylos carnosus TaxID=1234261 RepID=A0A815ZCS4_9BILA|nr:unnamed protein product [Didymodactylos carnosus]CAF1583152.1 unnamed protein product [Didymodactylos carnosus]CAF4292559.1 unnamed protein product [Didymodactylos carnosus]CAF4451423.1 unnamed protein product [Didymodactylos carnosus]